MKNSAAWIVLLLFLIGLLLTTLNTIVRQDIVPSNNSLKGSAVYYDIEKKQLFYVK